MYVFDSSIIRFVTSTLAQFTDNAITGRVTTTVTSPSSPLVTSARPLPPLRTTPTRSVNTFGRRLETTELTIPAERHRRCPDRAHSHSPHPSRPRPELLCLLLRDPQLAGPCLPPRQAGLRRRHCRARQPQRGVLPRQHPHHAAPPRQPYPLDLF